MRQPRVNDELLRRIDTEPDFVLASNVGNSLKRLTERYPDGVPPHVEARALGRTEKQAQALWASLVRMLRKRIRSGKED